MALLQIAEPGLSAAPHQHRLAVGIDLGTTHSLVASVLSGSATALGDAAGRVLLPSIVRFGAADELPVVGLAAQAGQIADPLNTLSSIKRLMGRSLRDLAAHDVPYALLDDGAGIAIRTAAGIKTPVEVAAQILRVLRERAEASLGGELVGAVITVPAYFDDAQRQATKDAARLAGLTVLRLLNEPTAAAVAYGLDNAAEGVFAVYDLGGGTFDISILRLSKGVFEVLATGGDTALGGDDVDARVCQWMMHQAGLAALEPADARRLLTLARSAKEALSEVDSTQARTTLGDGRRVDCLLARPLLEELSADLVQRTLACTRKALRDAALAPGQLDGVVLVGGSTRLFNVRTAVAGFFGKEPLTNLDPDQVVALGAAMQANVLAGNHGAGDWLLLDVCPLSLGLETMGGLVEKIIARNSTLPLARAQDFTTFQDGQTAMSIHVVQGERELVSDCRSLARFELRGIPPMVAGAARIRISFQIDADGLLGVSARELSTGIEACVEVRPSYGLDDAAITRMLAEAYARAGDDQRVRALREAQVQARQLIDATQAALAADGAALLAPPEREDIARHVFALADLIQTGGPDSLAALRAASDRLNEATRDFAARRMNASVQRALTGRRLQDVAPLPAVRAA